MFLHDVGSLEWQIYLLELGKRISQKIIRIHKPSFLLFFSLSRSFDVSLVRFCMKNSRVFFFPSTRSLLLKCFFTQKNKKFEHQILIKPPRMSNFTWHTDINELNGNGWQLTVAETKWLSSSMCFFLTLCVVVAFILTSWNIFHGKQITSKRCVCGCLVLSALSMTWHFYLVVFIKVEAQTYFIQNDRDEKKQT